MEEYWQVFTDLKREGKIRAAGLSNHGICRLEEAEQIGTVDVIQPPFNLIHRDAAGDVLRWAREHEAGVIVYSPMASGLLTGAFTAARAARLEPGGRRDRRRPRSPSGRRVAARSSARWTTRESGLPGGAETVREASTTVRSD